MAQTALNRPLSPLSDYMLITVQSSSRLHVIRSLTLFTSLPLTSSLAGAEPVSPGPVFIRAWVCMSCSTGSRARAQRMQTMLDVVISCGRRK